MKLPNVSEYIPNTKSVVKVAVSLAAIATAIGLVAMLSPKAANVTRAVLSNGLTGLLPTKQA